MFVTRAEGEFTCDMRHALLIIPNCVIYYLYPLISFTLAYAGIKKKNESNAMFAPLLGYKVAIIVEMGI